MKNLVFLFALVIGLVFQSQAQRATTIPLAAGDTAVNTGTASKVISPITSSYSGIVIQAKATELSGTSAGTIKIQGSLDGTNYDDIGSAYTVTDVASQVKSFYIVAPLPVYIKVLQTGSGTMSSVLSVKYVLKRFN